MQESPPIQQPLAHSGTLDSQLLETWVKHERQADFKEIVRRHLGLVQGIACRQVGHDQAEDIAQRVFAILARKASSLTDLRSLSAWLHRVTMLQCRNAVRSQMRDRRNQEAAMETERIASARDPLADALPHLDAAIGELSASDRELILLRYSEGLGFSEAAKRTGRKEAALRQQASRAVEKLSTILRRRGVSVPAATLTTGLGIHLAGNSAASAALLVSGAALASSGGISTLLLAGITFFTMTAKQSIIAGAVLASLLVSVPLVVRATQIYQLEKDLTAIYPMPADGNPGNEKARTHGPDSPAEKTKSARDRANKTPTDAEKTLMENAIPQMAETAFKETMNEWFARDAWMEARQTASALRLSEALETDLRNFLISEHTKVLGQNIFGDKKEDKLARRRAEEGNIVAWFATHLTPEQQQGHQRLKESRKLALIDKLASSALLGIRANVELTPEQESQLYDAATLKATHCLEENIYERSFFIGIKLQYPDKSSSIEETSEGIVSSILTPEQKELWKTTLERDRAFSDGLQKRVMGGVLAQIKKLKPTPEEIRKISGK